MKDPMREAFEAYIRTGSKRDAAMREPCFYETDENGHYLYIWMQCDWEVFAAGWHAGRELIAKARAAIAAQPAITDEEIMQIADDTNIYVARGLVLAFARALLERK